MSVETDIQAALASLVSSRVYPDTAPAAVAKPYIVYQQVGGRPVAFLESAVVGKRNGRFQVMCWATSRTAVASLSRSVADTLVTNSTLRAVALSEPIALHEPALKLYGTSQDFSIWF